MRRMAAVRIASRVVLPSRSFAVEPWVGGVLVVVICTNRSVQKVTPDSTTRQVVYREKADDPTSRTGHGFPGAVRAALGVKGALRGPLSKEWARDAEGSHYDRLG